MLLDFECVKDFYKADLGKRYQGIVHDLYDAIGALDKEQQLVFIMYAASKRV